MHQTITRNITLTAVMSAILLLSACESNDKDDTTVSSTSSSGSAAYIPQIAVSNVQVHFPPPAVTTEDETIIVRGEVTDSTDIAQLFINGTAVSTGDSFATWQATVALSGGPNTLTLTQEDASGAISTVSVLNVSRETQLVSPKSMAIDTSSNRLLIWDNSLKALVAMDMTSGVKTRLSPTDATTNLISSPRDIAIDPARNRALLFKARTSEETSGPQVVGIDLSSGEQSWVTIEDDPTVIELDTAQDIFIEGNTAYLADMEGVFLDRSGNRITEEGAGASAAVKIGIIYRVNLEDGSKTILSNYGTPNKELVSAQIIDMSTSLESEVIYVVDRVNISDDEVQYRLYTVSKDSGERQALSIKDAEDKALTLINPKALSLDEISQKLFVLDGNSLLDINLTTNTYSTLSAIGTPQDSEYLMLNTKDMTISNGAIYILDDAADYVLSVSPLTGERSQLPGFGADNPDGVATFSSVSDVSFDAENNRVFNVDKIFGSVTSVDLGDASKVTVAKRLQAIAEAETETETEPYPVYPISSAINYTTGELLVLDNYNQRAGVAVVYASAPRLLGIDLATSTVSAKLFFGNAAAELYDIAIDEGAQIAYTVEGIRFTNFVDYYIRKIDLSGEQVTSSLLSHSRLPNTQYPFKSIRSLAIDHDRERLLVTDIAQKAIIAVSLKDGSRSQFSNAGYPIDGGPVLDQPKAITIDRKRNRALVIDSASDSIVAIGLETGQRDILVTNINEMKNKLYSPLDFDIHPLFDYAVIVDGTSDRLMAVDLITNQVVTISR